jgi:hypothetical protein
VQEPFQVRPSLVLRAAFEVEHLDVVGLHELGCEVAGEEAGGVHDGAQRPVGDGERDFGPYGYS